MDDIQLKQCIDRIQAGEAEAFDQLVDHYSDRVFGYLFRMTGSRHDAEDLAQEVFVRLPLQLLVTGKVWIVSSGLRLLR